MIRLFILLQAALFLNAADVTKSVNSAELAEKLKQYRSIATISAPFKQKKTFKDIDMVLKSEGQFELSRTSKTVTWQVLKPSPLKVILNGVEVKMIGPESTQTFKISEIGGDKAMKSLTSLVAWLELDAEKLTRDYGVSQLGPDKFRFVPKTDTFGELDMQLNPKGFLTKLEIHERSGDKLEIDFGTPKISRSTQ